MKYFMNVMYLLPLNVCDVLEISRALRFEILKYTEIFLKYLMKYFKIKNTVFLHHYTTQLASNCTVFQAMIALYKADYFNACSA